MRLFLILATLLGIPLILVAQSEGHGRVTGDVVNEAGEAIGDASVCYSAKYEHGSGSGCSSADAYGKFDIEVPFEANRIFAEKPAAGYLSDKQEEWGVSLHLNQSEPSAHVVLKMGAYPAQLTFNVSAEDSGKPISQFTLRWFVINDDPGVRFSFATNGNAVSVPPNQDVLLIVQAPGYRRWFYQDAASPGQPTLRLQSGEHRTINAELEPLSPQN
jgi:hypothetical protein